MMGQEEEATGIEMERGDHGEEIEGEEETTRDRLQMNIQRQTNHGFGSRGEEVLVESVLKDVV